METTGKASSIHRELTSSERAIIVAEIEDRFKRLLKAQFAVYKMQDRHYVQYWENRDGNPTDEEERNMNAEAEALIQKMRQKHSIPDLVYIWPSREDGIGHDYDRNIYKYFKAFVAGTMTEESFFEFVDYCEEFHEFDYGWVLLGEPLRYYSDETTHDERVKIMKELHIIATRSTKKTRLKHLGWQGPACVSRYVDDGIKDQTESKKHETMKLVKEFYFSSSK